MKLKGRYDTHALTSVIKGARPPVDRVFQRFNQAPPSKLHYYANGSTLLLIRPSLS